MPQASADGKSAKKKLTICRISILRLTLWILIFILFAWNYLYLGNLIQKRALPLYDYIEYWSAGRVILNGGNPYSEPELLSVQQQMGWERDRPLMMWNPPWTLIFILPFAALPFWIGRGIWFLGQMVLLVVAADWLWRHFGGSITFRWLSWLASVLFLPSLQALFLGQISPFMFFGIVGFIWALHNNRPLTAGAFTVLLAVKPHVPYLFWVFLLFWVLKEKRWLVAVGAATAVGASLTAVHILNPRIVVHYWEALFDSQGPVIWLTPTLGMALQVLIPRGGALLRFLPSLMGLMVSLWLWKHWRSRFDWCSSIVAILLFSVIFGSFSWTFDWILLIPVVLQILIRFLANPRGLWWMPLGLALLQLLLFVTFTITKDYFWTLWFPPSIAALYFATKRSSGIQLSHRDPSTASRSRIRSFLFPS